MRKGTGLSRSAPKYLDYVVTLLLLLGTLQIGLAEPWIASYIDRRKQNSTTLVERVRTVALKDLQNECGKNRRFTDANCKRLREVATHPDLAEFIRKDLSNDDQFLKHEIGWMPGPHGGSAIFSPILVLVQQLIDRTKYTTALPRNESAGQAWSWVALLLLPVVLAVRTAKTTLELFAELA